ncbi:MAG: PAS domain-containing protein [Flavobacterium sp.]
MDFGLALKTILDNSLESIVFISPEHKVIAFNKTIQDTLLLYHGRHLQIGDDYRDYVAKHTEELYHSTFSKVIKGETVITQNETKTDTFSIWFEYKMNPVYSQAGELLGVILNAKNIDNQKKAEIELENLADTVEAIFENTTETIVLIDQNLKLLRFNKAASDSIKRQRNKIASIGDDFRNFINEAEVDSFLKLFYKALGGEPVFSEIHSKNHREEPSWFQVRMQPVYKKNDELLGVSIFTINITENKLAQFSLKENEDKFKEIAWNQSHIIRAPVAKILGITNIIKDFTDLDEEEKKEWVNRLLSTTQELDSVIKNIVNLAEKKENQE